VAILATVTNNHTQYDPISKAAHWLTFALVAAQFSIGWLMPEIGWGTEPKGLIGVHLALGASTLIVVAFRLIWRIRNPPPAHLPLAPKWQRFVAWLTHFGLYMLLIVMSLTGWASASAREWPVRAFGFIPLPALVPPDAKIGFVLGDRHAGILCWAFLALIGIHTIAALYHRFVVGDAVLQRMLPSPRVTSRRSNNARRSTV
jgi:cytochrome b561